MVEELGSVYFNSLPLCRGGGAKSAVPVGGRCVGVGGRRITQTKNTTTHLAARSPVGWPPQRASGRGSSPMLTHYIPSAPSRPYNMVEIHPPVNGAG
ncbi:MAG: hypothetical protein OT477_02680 [Chloroflexi bacterium]|nr:hypothetical protein [Chloroflexota bacterium]